MRRDGWRRLTWLGVTLCVVALALGVAKGLFWSPGVTAANFNRVRLGMTETEVDGIFGCQASAYHLLMEKAFPGEPACRAGFGDVWADKAGVAYIHFGLDRRVKRAHRFDLLHVGDGGRWPCLVGGCVR
ncbi:MAG TPA: hypothetical protein VEL76_28180 [Gemmataceae bacterium]|nr:hypothetical protein [Gemmataceae bacterium]